jgi:hypothetical protein
MLWILSLYSYLVLLLRFVVLVVHVVGEEDFVALVLVFVFETGFVLLVVAFGRAQPGLVVVVGMMEQRVWVWQVFD